jgi:hypothetical protein
MFLFAIGDQIAALTRPTDLALLPVIDDGVLGRDVALDSSPIRIWRIALFCRALMIAARPLK